MLEITRKRGPFLLKEIWFSPRPYVVTGFDKVIFKNCEEPVDLDGFRRENFATLAIDLTLDLDTIWKNMSSYCRRDVKRAERRGVTVRLSEDFDAFYSIYSSFKEKKKLRWYFPMNKAEFTKYVRNGVLFATEFHNRMIAGHVWFHDEHQMRGIVTASRRLESNSELGSIVGCGNRLSIWRAIEYAKNSGMGILDLGGFYVGSDQNDPRYSINQFKLRFGGKLKRVYHYYYYSRMLSIVRPVQRLQFHLQNVFDAGPCEKKSIY